MGEFTVIWLSFFTFLCLLVTYNEGATSSQKLCGNADCSVPISRARTLILYSSPKEGHVSFKKGMEVDVYSKQKDFWSVKIGKEVGFAPPSFLKEMRLLVLPKDLLSIDEDVASESVKVETTQNDSVDLPMEMTAEIPAGIGSLLSFPSMAAAESVQGQQDNLPTPSSPQYEVVDGTVIWMDPVPPSEGGLSAMPYATDKTEKEPPASDNVSEPSPETLQNIVPASDSRTDIASEVSSILQTATSQNSQEVTEAPTTSIPIGTTPSFVDDLREPSADASQKATTVASQDAVAEMHQEATTEASQEAITEVIQEEATKTTQEETTEALQEATTERPSETTEGTTESLDIQPTEAGIMSHLWNSVFNSGDGTEDTSQQNDEEGKDMDEDEDEEEDDNEGEGDEEEEDSAEEGSKQTSPVANISETSGDSVESSSAGTLSVEDAAQNVIVDNVPQAVTASPEELASSFSQTPNDNLDAKMRSARQTETFSGEVTSGEDAMVEDNMQIIGEQQAAARPPALFIQNEVVEKDINYMQGEDPQLQQVEEEKLKQDSEEQKRQQEVEQKRQHEEEEKRQHEEEEKRQHEEEQKRQHEEEQKRQHEEEQKRQHEEEQKRRQEEEQKRQHEEEQKHQQEEQKRQQDEEQKRQQDEQKRLQEEEQERQREEEQKRQLEEEQIRQQAQQKQEEQRRQQEEADRKHALEEENKKSLEEEKVLWIQNQEKQRKREEEMKRQREEAKQKQVQELLDKESEKNKGAEEATLLATEEKQIELPSSTAEQETGSKGMFSWFAGLFGSNAESGNTESEVNADQSQQQELQSQESQSQESQPQIDPAPQSLPNHHHEHPPVWSSEQQTTCSADEAGCGMTAETELDSSSLFMGIQTPSLDVILLRLTATAVALFLGALSFYFLRKKNVDSSLVAKINELEKQLLVASKEAVILREEASTLDASVHAEELDYIREELESSRIIRSDLEEQVSTLERELEEATETGIELNKLLSETLEASKGKAHAGLAASVERLQQQLDSQRDKVDSLTRSLKSTSAENENLKSMAVESRERIAALEAELAAAADIANNTRREKEEANLLAAQELQQVQSRLEEALSSKVLEESRLGSELSTLKLKHETLRSALSMRDAEVKALQETLKELESGETDQLLDVSKVKAEIEHTKKERDTYLAKYQDEEKARKDNEERLNKITETLKKLEEKVDVAEKCKEEAETRLTVLSNYFKEKEEQLQKELGLKEAIVAQHRGDESTVVKHLQLLQEEVNTYRAQNESLKQEILDQERDFKGQMATLEKKAHDNWMTARQAERRLEDSRQEAAQLRNRLTHVEKSNADPNARLEANGEGGVVSPVMMMPLPPLGDMETPPPLPPFMFSPPPYPPPFMPPPLPPHPMGRPPPLGRMSSPPPPLGQFSPPPPPYDRLDRSSRSRSPSPPPHRYHHRSPPPPQQWDVPPLSFRPVPKPSPKKPHEQREHKGSMHSSGHSNELADKSREHV